MVFSPGVHIPLPGQHTAVLYYGVSIRIGSTKLSLITQRSVHAMCTRGAGSRVCMFYEYECSK